MMDELDHRIQRVLLDETMKYFVGDQEVWVYLNKR